MLVRQTQLPSNFEYAIILRDTMGDNNFYWVIFPLFQMWSDCGILEQLVTCDRSCKPISFNLQICFLRDHSSFSCRCIMWRATQEFLFSKSCLILLNLFQLAVEDITHANKIIGLYGLCHSDVAALLKG